MFKMESKYDITFFGHKRLWKVIFYIHPWGRNQEKEMGWVCEIPIYARNGPFGQAWQQDFSWTW